MMFPFLILTLAATAVAASASHQIRAANTSACPVSSVPAAANYTGTTHNKGTQTRLRISNGGGTPSTIILFISISYFVPYRSRSVRPSRSAS